MKAEKFASRHFDLITGNEWEKKIWILEMKNYFFFATDFCNLSPNDLHQSSLLTTLLAL